MPMNFSEADPSQLRAVDFFCGAGGMSFGLSQAGVQVIGGIDIADDCAATYEWNIAGAKYIQRDITTLKAVELERLLGVRRNDPNMVFSGCSPCQFWSKIRTDRSKSLASAYLLGHLRRLIKYFRPGFVVIENVPGLYRRNDNRVLRDFLGFLCSQRYFIADGILNAAHFGVPQNRFRYVMIASRIKKVRPLRPTHTSSPLTVSDFLGVEKGFASIPAGHTDPTPFRHTAANLSELNARRIALTPASGGDRSSWAGDPSLQIPAYAGKDNIFRDVYGRMAWDRPAPTITTRFVSLSNGRFGHPEENRAISIREGASLQTFPKNFLFHSNNLFGLARQIGNAVPPALARCIGEHLIAVRNG